MRKLTAELCRTLISAMKAAESAGTLSIANGFNLQAMDIALPVLEQQEFPTDTYRQIENDGWIEWGGGEMPVPENTFIDFLCRDGDAHSGYEAREIGWYHDGAGADIIAYRVIENDGRGQK